MTRTERDKLRHQVDQAKRLQIARAHGQQETPWTDDPGYVGPQRDRRKHAHKDAA